MINNTIFLAIIIGTTIFSAASVFAQPVVESDSALNQTDNNNTILKHHIKPPTATDDTATDDNNTSDKQQLNLGDLKINIEEGTNFQLQTGDSEISVSPKK